MARPQASRVLERVARPSGSVFRQTVLRGGPVLPSRGQGSPRPAAKGRSLMVGAVTTREHGSRRHFLLPGHELSKDKLGWGPAEIPSARVSGGNSATTTIRPAPHRGQTRVGVTTPSWTGGVVGSGSVGTGSAGVAAM